MRTEEIKYALIKLFLLVDGGIIVDSRFSECGEVDLITGSEREQ